MKAGPNYLGACLLIAYTLFSTTAWAGAEDKAAAAGLTLVEYCRRAIFKSSIAPVRTSTDQALLVELNRVGVNLNQMARRVNAGRDLPPDFPDVLAEVREAIRKVLAHGS